MVCEGVARMGGVMHICYKACTCHILMSVVAGVGFLLGGDLCWWFGCILLWF